MVFITKTHAPRGTNTFRRSHSLSTSTNGFNKNLARYKKFNSAVSVDSTHRSQYYSSNHIMVNRERIITQLPSLKRVKQLDEYARSHAKAMADEGRIFHSVETIQLLQAKLRSEHVGENIHVGKTIKDIHAESMNSNTSGPRLNILSQHYNEFGMGTYIADNGKLYMVQLFRQNNSRCSHESI